MSSPDGKMRSRSFAQRCAVAIAVISSQPLTSPSAHAQNRCQYAISEVIQDVEERIGAVISGVKLVSTAEWREEGSFTQSFQSPFNNADVIAIFYLASDMGRGSSSTTRRQAQAAENLMNSSQLTREYAKKIISACEPVASVKFHYWEWFQGWSLHRNNELLEDKCKNPDSSNYYWGENFCA